MKHPRKKDPATLDQERGRLAFWDAVEIHAPSIVGDLRTSVLPVWEEDRQRSKDSPDLAAMVSARCLVLEILDRPTSLPSVQAVFLWAERNRIAERWCRAQAAHTLDGWFDRSIARNRILGPGAHLRASVKLRASVVTKFKSDIFQPDLVRETVAQWRKRERARVIRLLDARLDEARAEAEARIAPADRLLPMERDLFLVWLVRVLQGESYASIGKSLAACDHVRVMRGAKKAAKLIGLRLPVS